MKRYRVVLLQPLHPSAMTRLETFSEVCIADRDSLLHDSRPLQDADALIFRFGSISSELLALGPKLRVVARPGVGYDGVDLQEAARRHITVALCPPENARAVAEHTLMLVLACAKNLLQSVNLTRAGVYGVRDIYAACDLEGKRITVCGFGNIGKKTAALCKAMGMHVTVFSRRHSPEVEALGYDWEADLKKALAVGDFVTLHMPLTAATAQILNREMLSCMKPGSYLINTARGGLVDYGALLEFVEQGVLGGAGLDVVDEEPISPHNPLLHHDRILVTPHMAALSAETSERMAIRTVEAVQLLLRGETWPYTATI